MAQNEIMLQVRRNHALRLYESLKKSGTVEEIESGVIALANETGAVMLCDPHEPKPEGYENGTVFLVQEFKKGIRIVILDDKMSMFYKVHHIDN